MINRSLTIALALVAALAVSSRASLAVAAENADRQAQQKGNKPIFS